MLGLLVVLFCVPAVVPELYPQLPLDLPSSPPKRVKRVAIVGMGAGGISSLKALSALPEQMRAGWEIVAFEKREAVGGLWIPQDDPPAPPAIPETPLYPLLRSNGPHPALTIPHWPLRPNTPLLAPRDTILQYHQDTVAHFNLSRFVRLQHVVHEARWIGTSTRGHWELSVEDRLNARNFTKSFDHLIAASGVNRFPRWVTWPGQDEWRALGKTITHSMYYRRPDVYEGRNVVVVGGGPSGWDLVRLLSQHAKTLYWSRDPERRNRVDAEFLPTPRGTVNVPRISSLSGGVVHLQDGRQLQDVDAIILATGYEIRMPFLTAGGCLEELDHTQPQPSDFLTTNSYYIHPLYEHTLSLDTRYPLGSLYFNGIIIYNPTGMTDYGQALFTAYTIANPALLQSRDELFAALKAREARVRDEGADPTHFGHKVNKGYGALFGHLASGSHEDLLVNYLRDRGLAGQPGIPPLGVNFTDPWRVFALEHGLEIHTAWYAGLEEQGEEWEKRLTRGRRTEEDYVRLMHEVVEWWAHKKRHL